MATKIRGITIDLGVDTSKLTKGLKDANSSLNSTQKQLKDVNKLLKLDPSNTTLLKQKTDLLNRAIDDSKKKLEEQKNLMEKLKEAGKTTDNQEQQEALQRDIEETTRKIKELVDEQKKMPSTFSATMQEAGQHVSDFGAKVEEFGSKMSVLSAGIAAIGGASVAAFNEVDKGYDSVIAKTGATGAELEGMQEIVDNIAGKMPSDFEEIGDAVGTVATRFHLSGDELEDVSTAFLQFASLNGTSVVSSIESVQKAMAAFGVDTKDVIPFLDQLNYVGQQTGVSMDSLATSMVSNAATLQEMGLSAEDSAQFLGQLEVSGVDASAVMSGLKKALANATAAGKDLPTALQELQDSMQNADSSTEALTKAYELFGNRAGGAIYNACKNGQIDFTNLAGAAEESATTVSGTFAETIDATDEAKIAFNNLKIAGSKLGASLLKTLQPAIEKVVKWVENATKKWNALDDNQKNNIIRIGLIVAAIGPLVTAIGKVISVAGTLMAHPMIAMIAGAAAVIGGITAAVEGLAEAQNNKLLTSLWGSVDAYKELNTSIEEYEQKRTERQDEVKTIDDETEVLKTLVEKYNELVDSKGKINQKDQEKADFYVTTLAEKLGLEKNQVLELRDANNELGKAMDDVIEKQRAISLKNSFADDYDEALANEKKAAQDYANAQEARDKAYTALQEAKKTRNGVEIAQAEKAYNDAVTLVAQTGAKYNEYKALVENYVGLSNAIDSGNADEIKKYTDRITYGFQTSETATVEYLEAQKKHFQETYDHLKEQVESGYISAEDANLKGLETMISDTESEIRKATLKVNGIVVDDSKKTNEIIWWTGESGGEAYGDGLINGMTAKQRAVYEKARELGMNVRTAQMEALDIHSPSKVASWVGKMYGAGLVKGLKGEVSPVSAAARQLANATNVPLGNTTTNYNSPTVVVHASAGQSASAIADAVINRLNNTYRQTTKTFA